MSRTLRSPRHEALVALLIRERGNAGLTQAQGQSKYPPAEPGALGL